MGLLNVVIVQLTNHVWLFATLWTAGRQAILSLIISWSLPTSCPLNWCCHPTILCSVTLFSFCLQFFPASGSFPMSRLFTSAGQSFGASSSASVLPVNIQGRFPLGWTSLISLQSKGFSRVFSNTAVQRHQCLGSLWSNSHIHTWLLENLVKLLNTCYKFIIIMKCLKIYTKYVSLYGKN